MLREARFEVLEEHYLRAIYVPLKSTVMSEMKVPPGSQCLNVLIVTELVAAGPSCGVDGVVSSLHSHGRGGPPVQLWGEDG